VFLVKIKWFKKKLKKNKLTKIILVIFWDVKLDWLVKKDILRKKSRLILIKLLQIGLSEAESKNLEGLIKIEDLCKNLLIIEI
jgi:hypothetical protein